MGCKLLKVFPCFFSLNEFFFGFHGFLFFLRIFLAFIFEDPLESFDHFFVSSLTSGVCSSLLRVVMGVSNPQNALFELKNFFFWKFSECARNDFFAFLEAIWGVLRIFYDISPTIAFFGWFNDCWKWPVELGSPPPPPPAMVDGI